ncbi:hypothetical protein M0R45_000866 [Rubus argutus]|uniref:Uncharacterized protein n=1 Tax=Rubus argutus TaxID=59490 RepID=A0AAW1VNA2_RUBAR
MSCLVDHYATCSTFKGGFGRHQAQASSMVVISPMMILGGEIAIDRGSLQREVSPVGWWHAHVGMVGEQFRPPNSLGWSVPSSTKVRPPDLSVGYDCGGLWMDRKASSLVEERRGSWLSDGGAFGSLLVRFHVLAWEYVLV